MGSNRGGVGVVVVLVIVGGAALSQATAAPSADSSAGCTVHDPPEVEGFGTRQVSHAATITEVATEMGMPRRAVVVALAAAMQESGLRNLPYGDRDSLGLFQQRPSQGWGTAKQVRKPRHAARSFFRTLRKVDSWQEMRITDAAQAVQRSAYPEAYQKHAKDARRLAKALLRRCG